MNKPIHDLKPESEVTLDPLALLRAPFPPNQISKLPKPTAGREVMDKLPKATCNVCGGYHATTRVIHLDYVGHAALTDRLLDADPLWTWEPCGLRDGLPALDANGGLWIKLTVCGVTRLGYGAADGKKGGDAVKELIGDALRNAAMRFGAALDLWHKGDLHAADADADEPEAPAPTAEEMATNLLKGCGSKEMLKDAWEHNQAGWRGVMDEPAYKRVKGLCIHLVKQFDERAKPAPSEGFDVLNGDEIPF